jgi:hypothetical protein
VIRQESECAVGLACGAPSFFVDNYLEGGGYCGWRM